MQMIILSLYKYRSDSQQGMLQVQASDLLSETGGKSLPHVYSSVNYETSPTRLALPSQRWTNERTSLILTHTHLSGSSDSGASLQHLQLYVHTKQQPCIWAPLERSGLVALCKYLGGGNGATKMPTSLCGSWEMISNVNMDGYMIALGEFLSCCFFPSAQNMLLYGALTKSGSRWCRSSSVRWRHVTIYLKPTLLMSNNNPAGIGPYLRKIALKLKMRKVIEQKGEQYIIKTCSIFRNYSICFRVGQVFEEFTDGLDNRHVKVTKQELLRQLQFVWPVSSPTPPDGSKCSVLIRALLWPRCSRWWHGRETNWCVSRSERRKTAAGLTGSKMTSCIWYGSEQHGNSTSTTASTVVCSLWKGIHSSCCDLQDLYCEGEVCRQVFKKKATE